MGRVRGTILSAVVAVLAMGGCGPIAYVNQVTMKASSSVESARAAEADKYSPYWYTRAVEYLHKAREEAADADFQAANRFGRKSEAAAKKAREEAIAHAGKPVEQFYPNVVPKRGDKGKRDDDSAADAPAEGLAPLVPGDDDDSGSDDETPPAPEKGQ
jgi:hypothetical protein